MITDAKPLNYNLNRLSLIRRRPVSSSLTQAPP